tara:strand:+ start:377 stop:955 length:579 start_codon:yes stop_codon:yes gene_type:complete
MINKDLTTYVHHYKNFLSKDICKQTVKELKVYKKQNWREHTFYNRFTNTEEKLSGNKELSTMYSDDISTVKIIMDTYYKAIQKYMDYYNFSWWDSWAGFSLVRFNKYMKNKKMAEHCDHITTIFDGNTRGIPILSILTVLNDDYEGGEFFIHDKQIKLKSGDVLIFPSNFLYPHKVESVTKGTRYSMISWVY